MISIKASYMGGQGVPQPHIHLMFPAGPDVNMAVTNTIISLTAGPFKGILWPLIRSRHLGSSIASLE